MRFIHPDGSRVHLAYCTNVHPAEDIDGLLRQLRVFGGGIRAELGVDRLGVGLWLPAQLAAHLADHPDLERLRSTLDEHGLEVVTLNAFPYQGFHAPVVKKAVYSPDWVETRRLDYTLTCARVLSRLLPDDAARGSISTVPLAWRTPWYSDRRLRARELLDRLAEGLAKVTAETGRPIRVGLEPEPGCVVETIDEAIEQLAGVDTDHIGLCLDACHLAVGFEDPVSSVRRLADAGLPIVKTQASAALHAATPADPATRQALSSYAEDRFLHQVRERGPARLAERGSARIAGLEDCSAARIAGREDRVPARTIGLEDRLQPQISGRDDLPDAIDGHRALPGEGPWRVHFHVPIHQRPQPPLESTQDELGATLDALLGGPAALTDHVEMETYTWSVLPDTHRPSSDAELISGLAAELRWVADRMRRAGLEEA